MVSVVLVMCRKESDSQEETVFPRWTQITVKNKERKKERNKALVSYFLPVISVSIRICNAFFEWSGN